MRIIVSDTSCMVDLRKAELLEALLKLPYTFVMPNTLFEHEWLCLSPGEKKRLCDQGLEVRELPGPAVERAAVYFNQHRRLELNDCYALTLTEDLEDSVLLTGDGLLRRVAEENGVGVRGVLWVIDELEAHCIVPLRRLHDVLQVLRMDPLVFLPEAELVRRLRRLARLLS